MAEPTFWRSKEAAAYLGISVHTLYHWLNPKKRKNGTHLIGPKPPHRRYGRNCIRFPIKELQQWAAAHEKGR